MKETEEGKIHAWKSRGFLTWCSVWMRTGMEEEVIHLFLRQHMQTPHGFEMYYHGHVGASGIYTLCWQSKSVTKEKEKK